MEAEKKKGRPVKVPAEKMYFGLKCTEAEKDTIWNKINEFRLRVGRNATVSEFFLDVLGLR